ncbi:MAG: thioredoxin domain-containing protein, partial [Gemmatimonadetes bacterium]
MTNRLADATSPYLRQHAHNPVDWLPWGAEAFARARAEDRPLLVSIGYSACHWCHVMERESFDDPETAALMNERFVCVKVDREERPDVDAVYMRAVQALTGHGGWPLTVFLTPDGRPYYGGTYFPPQPRHGVPSFRQVLRAVSDAYRQRPDEVERAAAELLDVLERSLAPRQPSGDVDPAGLVEPAEAALTASLDPVHGGFGGAPKFPQALALEFLLVRARRRGGGVPPAVANTLDRMAAGGIHDHLAGGFHRYTVDTAWLVPHFEKMLYDNALLARVYGLAARIDGTSRWRAVAERTLDYVLADLRHAAGGFFAARDADSEGEEGRFYLWTPDEIGDALAGDEAARRIALAAWGVRAGGNFEGRSILHRPQPLEAAAAEAGLDVGEAGRALERARTRLLEVRAQRPQPFRDEKVIVSWNALTIRALAEVGGAFARTDYVEAAARAARFLLAGPFAERPPRRVWIDGHTAADAVLEDYAALGNALISLHEATLEPRWLEEARALIEVMLERFGDDPTGAFHDTAADAETLVVRPRDVQDGAQPSGTALAVELLVRGGRLFGRPEWEARARRALALEAASLERWPTAFGRLLTVADALAAGPAEIVLVGPADRDGG